MLPRCAELRSKSSATPRGNLYPLSSWIRRRNKKRKKYVRKDHADKDTSFLKTG